MKTKLFNAIAGTAVIGISLFTTIPAKASITYYSKTGTLIFKNDGISTSTAYTFTGRIYKRHSDPSFANPITGGGAGETRTKVAKTKAERDMISLKVRSKNALQAMDVSQANLTQKMLAKDSADRQYFADQEAQHKIDRPDLYNSDGSYKTEAQLQQTRNTAAARKGNVGMPEMTIQDANRNLSGGYKVENPYGSSATQRSSSTQHQSTPPRQNPASKPTITASSRCPEGTSYHKIKSGGLLFKRTVAEGCFTAYEAAQLRMQANANQRQRSADFQRNLQQNLNNNRQRNCTTNFVGSTAYTNCY